ncbi:RNA-binding domain-containing protein [Xylariaceae sp. FL1651]|nr:RNA-binding domain-containing protein [Xylariaceae sp. FL1651]
MHSIRRATLRAAWSSSRAVAVPRQQIAFIAMQSSKVNAQVVGIMRLSRYFSQTAAAAQDGKEFAETALNDSVQSAEQIDTPHVSEVTTLEQAQEPAGDSNSIFINNMSFDATDAHLQEAFSKYGEITYLNIVRDIRGLSRGFAFITFTEKEAADRAVAEAHNSFWHGRRINVAPRRRGPSTAKPKQGNSEPTTSLYIGNIPYETSDAELNKMFRNLENVKDVRVAVDRNTGWPRGFAHADFADIESAMKAHQVLSEATMGGRKLRIDYSSAPNPRKNQAPQTGKYNSE